MSLKVRVAGAWKTVAPTNVMRVRRSGAWKTVERMRIWRTINGLAGWREFYVKSGTTPTPNPSPTPAPSTPPRVTLKVTLTPTQISGTKTGIGTVLTPSVTASISNGTAPFTYAWQVVKWSALAAPTAVSPAAATTTFSQTGMGTDDYQSATFKVTVKDVNGNKGSAQILVEFYTSTRERTIDGVDVHSSL